jgi:hypothetical protein
VYSKPNTSRGEAFIKECHVVAPLYLALLQATNSALVINFASFKLNIRTTFEAQLHVLYPTFYLQKLEL